MMKHRWSSSFWRWGGSGGEEDSSDEDGVTAFLKSKNLKSKAVWLGPARLQEETRTFHDMFFFFFNGFTTAQKLQTGQSYSYKGTADMGDREPSEVEREAKYKYWGFSEECLLFLIFQSSLWTFDCTPLMMCKSKRIFESKL